MEPPDARWGPHLLWFFLLRQEKIGDAGRPLQPASEEVYEYRLGNRGALEWVVDQYRVSTDARSGIVNDPNREDDPEYIVRLVGQVVTVSVETVRLVKELAVSSIDEV
ncbi:MAG: type ISP restriction/modification enzyme [Terracidiphilus sp.]